MGISKVSNRWLNRTYKCIAILLVVFAVLISALRLFLPYAHNYRIDLQNYINERYGSHIVIGSLDMGWQSVGPTLVASNVSLLQTDGAEIYVQAFDLNIDFWRSIRYRRIITKDCSLDGVKILFDKTMVSNTQVSDEDSSLLNNITELFFSQIGRFSVNNSQVIYRTDKGQRTFLIDSLHWLNQGDSHKASGNVVLDGLTSNNLQLKLQVKGDSVEQMHGTMYLEANQLNITPWLGKVFAIEDENTHSTINFNAWLTIDNGLAKQLQVALGQNQIAWQHNEAINTLNISGGQLVFEHLDEPTQLTGYSSVIDIQSNEQTWQPLSFEMTRDQDSVNAYISAVDVAGMADLLPLFVKDSASRTLIEQLNPVGQVSDIYFEYSPTNTALIAQAHELTSHYSQGIPGIENLSGQVIYQPGAIYLDIMAKNGALDFDKHFAKPIGYQNLSAKLDLKFDDAGWQLTSDDVNFSSEQVKLNAELAVFSPKEQEAVLSLLATAKEGNVVFAQSFYPQELMGQDLISYLNGSLEKGQLDQALVLINGPLNSFPYQDGSGSFIVDAELSHATFNFDKKWPAIQHFSANLNFTDNSMLITGRDGTLSGIDVKGVRAAIDDLQNEQVLTVDAKFNQTSPELVSTLMLSSPYSDSVGAVLERAVIGNKIAGQFSLSLPLQTPELAIAKGTVIFDNNKLNLQSPEMLLTDLNGQLFFENAHITTENLTAMWRGMPLAFDVNGENQEHHYQTDIDIAAQWQDTGWLEQLPQQLKTYGNGMLDWQGRLTLNNEHQGKFSYQLAIDSELVGLQLALPAPFNKTKEQQVSANIRVSGNEDQSTIDAKIGEQLNFYGNLNHQQVAFSQAHLILGNEQMYLPLNGFHITTNLANADFMQWQPLVLDIIASVSSTAQTPETSSHLLEQPERIRGNIANLTFFNEQLHGVSFNLEDQLSWWLLDLSSKEARGQVKFYPDWHSQGLDVAADFIKLSPNRQLFSSKDNGADEKALTPELKSSTQPDDFNIHVNDELFSDIPPIRFSCGDCSYANLHLGEVSFSLIRKQADQLAVKNFVAKRKNTKLNFDATWHHDQQNSITSVKGEFSTKDVEREFERLGIPSTVRDSGLKSSFDVNWLGGPQDFAIAHFNGDLSGKLDEGYLAEVPDQARAFSILSLQSLVRKLKFDFRDIFSDGMFYSEVKGDFHVQNGVIYTKNTFLKGSAGDLAVKGNTDLNTETLDYRMSYKPNVTSSLPAIAWIATLNPVTFLAGIAIDEVITSKVVSEYKFEVTGSIDEPSFKEVDRKTQNISVGRDSPPQIVENLPQEQKAPTGQVNPETGLLEEKDHQQPDKSDG